MFYSQFILAKKGPLGTIWIAAHLERKLRKNQVADTDIGVSVDSIICPEAPIALRLSSHLMLGVVRIYSRKVNYLFHDCSEALLKVKQAFRSAAVDLPPEESTAPYHSITLPETFDLDDFELPDNAIFDGNFVDHHVSTREQITLQDTLNGTVFSTTQFGLDERFGDGDASQIGLDLDEEMFLEKSASLPNSYVAPEEKIEHHTESEAPLTNMDVDNGQDGLRQHDHRRSIAEASKDLPNAFGYNIRTPDLNEMFSPAERTAGFSVSSNSIHSYVMANNSAYGDHSDHAQAPPIPGLLEEVIPVHVQEIPDMSQPDKPSPSNYVEEVAREASEVECQHKNGNIINGLSFLPECSVGVMGGNTGTISVDHDEKPGTFQKEVIPNDRVGMKQISTMISSQEPLMNVQAYLGVTMETPTMKTPVYELLGEGDNSSLTDNKPMHVGLSDMESTVLSHGDKPETHPHSSQEPAVHASSSITYDSHASISNFQLRPCFTENPTRALSFDGLSLSGDSHQLRGLVSRENVPDASGMLMREQGEGFCSANLLHSEMQMHRNVETPSLENSAFNKYLPTTSACIRTANLNCSASTEYPESERMLRTVISEHGLHLQQDIGQSVENQADALSFGGPSLLQSDVQMHKKLGTSSLENSAINKEYNLPTTSAIQTANLNCSSGSEYQEPERMFKTTASEHGLHSQRDLGRSILENREHALLFGGSSLLESDIQMHKNLETPSLKNSAISKEFNLPISSAIQTTNQNFSASSEYPEPGRMLRTTASEHNLHLQQDIGQSITENRAHALSFSGSGLLQSDIQLHKNSETPSLENSDLNKKYNFPASSACIRTGNLNCSAGSEYPEPERMLRLTANQNGLYLQQDIGQSTTENRANAISFGGPSLLQSDIQMHKSLETVSLGNSALNKEYNLPSTSAVRTANLKFSASSVYPDPERMLRATASEHGLQRDIGQCTVEDKAHALSFGGPCLLQSGIQMHKNWATSSLDNSVFNKVYNLPATSAIRTANLNHSASSGFPEPEITLKATASAHGLQQDIGQSVMDRAHTLSLGGPSLLQSGIQMRKGTASLENSTLNEEYNLPASSVCIETDNLNCSASSEYPEPERVLRATASEHHLQRYMEQSTVDKGVIEFDECVGKLQPLSGKRRLLMDNTPTVFNENSSNLPGPPRLKNNTSCVPGVDDLLASILVGRTTPSLKVKITPTLPLIPSSKRARLNSKTGTPKRKVLLDDTMVLHADTIRQQLLSTEDIRRVRKKAPCTRSDIWRMQKCLLEEGLFGESTLTGISDNLTILYYRVYNLNDTFRHGIDLNPSPAQISEAQAQTMVPPAVVNLKMSEVSVIKDSIGANVNPEFLVPPAVVNLKMSDVPVIKDTTGTNVNPECPVGNLVHVINCELVENFLAPNLHQNGKENVQDVTHRSAGLSCSIASDLHAGETRYMLPYKGVVAGSDQCKSASLVTDKNNAKEPSVTIADGAFHQSVGLSSIASDLHYDEVRSSINFTTVMGAFSDQGTESGYTDKHTVKATSVTMIDSAPHQRDVVTCSGVSDLHGGGIGCSMLLNQGVVAGSGHCSESASLLTDKNDVKQPSVTVTDSAPQQSDGLSCSIASDLHDGGMRYSMLWNKDVIAGSDEHIESASLLTGKDNVKEPSVMVADGSCSPQQNQSVLSDFPVYQAVNFCSASNLNITKDIDTIAGSRNDIPEGLSHSFHADKHDIIENSLEIRKEEIIDNQNVSPCQLPPETATNDEAMQMEFGISRDGERELSLPTEGEQHVSLCQLEPENVIENGVSDAGETSGVQEVNIAVPALIESRGGEATQDSHDDDNAVDGEDDSELLNVGNEVDFDDDNNYDMANPEEAQSQDNSGWSARTRGVARYLKLLFNEDTRHTRDIVALDRLLLGKTRKEASRMFFETLVLKTKDYVHVEQESSFANIDIKPRLKLLKLEFK